MHNVTTEAMEWTLQQYAHQSTFGPDLVTRAVLAGSHGAEWMRGVALAARLNHDQAQATIRLRYES